MTENKIIECGNGNIGFEEVETEITENELMFAELLTNYKVEKVKIGNIYNGELIEINDKYYIFDINNKSSVFIPKNETEDIALINVELGDFINVYITDIEDGKEYSINGSAYKLLMQELSEQLSDSVKNKKVLTGIPIQMNHAGYTLSVEVNNQIVYIFMPHLLTDVNKLPNKESIIGEEISFYVKEVKKDGQVQYIASRKEYLRSLISKEMRKLNKGQEAMGTVTGATKFGVFLQFNKCLTAMIHKSNLSEDGLEMFNNREIEAGMLLPFLIKSYDFKTSKIFGTQIVGESLWDKINVGDTLTGKIDDIKAFGLLVELDYETKGLIHKSNLENKQYKIGDMINVVITNVNKANRQVTLNFK